jgi:hypothetical protein
MQYNKYALYSVPLLLLSSIVLCLLFSACDASTPTTPVAHAQPVIDANLIRQGEVQLQTYRDWITLMQKYGGNVVTYQKHYTADQDALQTAPTNTAYQAALKILGSHIRAIKFPALQAEADQMHKQLQQKVANWSQKHTYHDNYDGLTYNLGYEYSSGGADGIIQSDLAAAQSITDYQQVIDYTNANLANFDAMLANSDDKTPYNQLHATDKQLMTRYHVTGQLVVLVSLQEQAMRVYQNGQLIKAFLVTTGRPTHPSLPGIWQVENMQSPTVFKSGVPVGSPDYYPDTPINYAMQYHSNGYFLHDSYWRADYGPGTNFPHQDASGNESANTGSHGCVNLTTANASWLYNFVTVGTPVIIY